MQLDSRVYFCSAAEMNETADDSVDLVVTSPPYPMIAMWDSIFSASSKQVEAALDEENGVTAFELMHELLDQIWAECFRVLRPGGFACINIGDATRKIGGDFMLYPNHSRISSAMTALGFQCLPNIHWFKPTNAPNKFMGSGMLPAGAYVTLEHEYILIFRKGGKRIFSPAESTARRRSAFFWEERNLWFSDVWDFRGVNQPIKKDRESSEHTAARDRSGAFPFELPHRLINMYSIQGDTVLDPFLGTGTTLAAAIVNGRSCKGYETDKGLDSLIRKQASAAAENAGRMNELRLQRHRDFISCRTEEKFEPKYMNEFYNFGVITRQEREIRLPVLDGFKHDDIFSAFYKM